MVSRSGFLIFAVSCQSTIFIRLSVRSKRTCQSLYFYSLKKRRAKCNENVLQVVGDRGKNSQSSSADIHKPSGVMFLALINQNALGCWKISNPLDTISVVQKDDQKMIYPSDVKISGDKIFVLTNTMPSFLYGRLNYDEVNFRVWSNSIEEAIQGTQCS